ncbi:MAG: hypothetical protein M3Q30_18590 [Actinomycetota bacterium]|nr:hypothetical protein [Actinomycetota bacterium]
MTADPLLALEKVDRSGRVAGAEFGKRFSFDRVSLSMVAGESDRVGPLREGGERAAGFDGGELVVVADEDDLRLSSGGMVQEAAEFSGADHRGFVDNDDRVRLQPPRVGPFEGAEERVERVRLDLRRSLELIGGSG